MVAVAVPSLTRQFHSIDQVGWYGAAFYMTNCTFQLLWGKFFTYINLKWSYILTILIFEIGLLVSGSAQTSAVFIAGRAIAGIGSGGMLTGSIVVITCSVAPEKRAKYIGWLGSMYGLAYGLGYLIGGVFADHVTWRWCFYINLPPGALVVVVMMAFLPAIASDPTVLQWPRKQRVAQLDIFGAIVLLGVLSCLLVALQWAGDIYSWFSGQVMTLLFASGILLTIWILIQYTRDERAMVPIRLIKLRSVTAGIFYGFCAGGVFLLYSLLSEYLVSSRQREISIWIRRCSTPHVHGTDCRHYFGRCYTAIRPLSSTIYAQFRHYLLHRFWSVLHMARPHFDGRMGLPASILRLRTRSRLDAAHGHRTAVPRRSRPVNRNDAYEREQAAGRRDIPPCRLIHIQYASHLQPPRDW